MEPSEVIFYPLMTESASLMVEKDNKLIFVVNVKAGKSDVKKAVEELYEVQVDRIIFNSLCLRRVLMIYQKQHRKKTWKKL